MLIVLFALFDLCVESLAGLWFCFVVAVCGCCLVFDGCGCLFCGCDNSVVLVVSFRYFC